MDDQVLVLVSAEELAEMARIVGVAPSSDWVTIRAAADKILAKDAAKREAESRAQAEKVLEAEDRRLVAAAVNDGRLSAKSAQRWRDALKQDRPANRLVLASLVPGIRPDGRIGGGPDLEHEQVYTRVMAALGFAVQPNPVPSPRVTREVMAAAKATVKSADSPRSGAEIDADPDYRDVAWRLGPGFRNGLKPPEARYFTIPGIDDDYSSELIDNGDGTAHWSSGAVRGD